MADASDKREAKKFEPPPWEREQFEELQRARQERAEEQELAAALEELEARPPEEAPEAEGAEQEALADPEPTAREGENDDKTNGDADDAIDADEINRMIIQLRAEDPPAGRELWKFGVAASAIVALVGAMLLIWGVVGVVRASRMQDSGGVAAGGLGAGIMVFFGLGFLGFGVWMAVRSLRQQGVL